MKIRLTLTIALTFSVAAAAFAGAATAATNVSQSRTPGKVVEAQPAVWCTDWYSVLAKPMGNTKDVYVNPPAVYAAALSNGSRQQYVSYAADIFDLTTGVNYPGTFTDWFSASTSTAAQLPQLHGGVPLYHQLAVRIHILWWDPVSKQYSGALDYTVNSYLNRNYEPYGLFSTASC